jgi:hypothetical protein
MIPAWIVCAWPAVLWQAETAPALKLRHLGTRILTFGDRAGACSGQTLWGDSGTEQPAGVAWDWVQVRGGAVAIADPLGLITNIRLLDTCGATLDDSESAMALNVMVHQLPWQTEVLRALAHEFGTADASGTAVR